MRILLITREGFEKWVEAGGFRPPPVYKIARMSRPARLNGPLDPNFEVMEFFLEKHEKVGNFYIYREER